MFLPLNFTPDPKDILCGRGNVFSNHEGNRYFGKIIRSNLREYMKASNRPEKIRAVDDILQEIRSSGARFAKVDSETKQWYELNDVQAHQKIGHAIRDTIRLLKDKTNNQKGQTKKSNVAKRQRKSRAFMLPKHMQPSFDTRQKTMGEILKMSIDTAEFLQDILGDYKDMPHQTQNDLMKECVEVKSENTPPPYHHERATSIGPLLLEDEYPEESFDFSATSFFVDENNARHFRIINQ